MSRIALFSHAPSDSITALKQALENDPNNFDIIKIRREGSRFRGRSGDVIFNYGSSQMPSDIVQQATVLNQPAVIANTSNKRTALQTMHNHSVPTVEWTTDRAVAQGWFENGDIVYARTQLQGHSGAGIVVCANSTATLDRTGGIETSNTLVNAQLYTKGITAQRREYRVHIFSGKVIYIQKKKRRDGFADNTNASNVVRNHHTGWIYSNQDANDINAAGVQAAVNAIRALGLSFGAVDIITRGDNAWVLEVNTAPGMSGTTLEVYKNALVKTAEGSEIEELAIATRLRSVNVPTQQATSNDQPTTSARTTEQPAQTQRTTAQPQQTRRTETPVPTAQTRRTTSNSTALVDNGYYWLEVNGERTIGKYSRNHNHFEIIGWEVPVERNEATLRGQILEA